jgi:hypothetical protein
MEEAMLKLELEVTDLVHARLTALASARNGNIKNIASESLATFAESPQVRREIRKARKASGNPSLADLGWLEGYAGQSMDELLSFEGSQAPERLLATAEEALRRKIKEERNWTAPERIIVTVMTLLYEVNNGGFDQYFRNSSLSHASVIVDDLKRVGCKGTAKIAQKAIKALRASDLKPDGIRAAMGKTDSRRDQTLHDCDEAFYNLNEIPDRLFAYMRENARAIRL